ncbi:hypothetical protein [Azospirillum sp. A23]|uniref:hypothetical protein n=1 Tax=Azospirillum sp. A23 TaxID=3160608 RepID=UPI0036F34DBD
MNHILRLQEDNRIMVEALETVDETVLDLFRYLTSTKFHEDTTVQVADVLQRLQPLRSLPRP